MKKLLRSLESYVILVIERKKRNRPLEALLCFLSWGFRAASFIRNCLYDLKFLKAKRIPLPVISIGNIIAGGTGKTPFIQKIAQDLNQDIAVLTRGYRGLDEPQLLMQTLPVYPDPNRLRAAKKIAHNHKALFLDDGMQHRKLHRDLEIVLLHCDKLFGFGNFLPRGYLRESPLSLKRADYIVINHLKDASQIAAIKEKITPYSKAPVIGVRVQLLDIERYRYQKVGAFCGIGSPQSFFQNLEENQIEIVEKLILPDHLSPSDEELFAFANRCLQKGAATLLCTEKDWIKTPKNVKYPLPHDSVKMFLEITSGGKHYSALLDEINKMIA